MSTQDRQHLQNGHRPEHETSTYVSSPPDDDMTAAPPPSLAEQASHPNAEPCEIAEAAMPDLVFGDLPSTDEDWVRAHTLGCTYCANVLRGLEDVCSSLDECNDAVCEKLADHRPPARLALGLPEARYGVFDTPVGDILVAASDSGVCEVSFLANRDEYDALRELERRGFLVYRQEDAVQPVIDQLTEYFSHERDRFTLPLDLTGVTDFTRDVLAATNRIPYGAVKTYGDIADQIGKPRSSRAVGNALGRNPIPVIVPCHRVVRSSGAMGWYTGGTDIKRTLLGIEGVRYGNASAGVTTARLPLSL